MPTLAGRGFEGLTQPGREFDEAYISRLPCGVNDGDHLFGRFRGGTGALMNIEHNLIHVEHSAVLQQRPWRVLTRESKKTPRLRDVSLEHRQRTEIDERLIDLSGA